MKTFAKLALSLGLMCSFVLSAGGGTTDDTKNTAAPSGFNRAQVTKLALLVSLGKQQQGFVSIIETSFLESLLPKGYDMVTRESLEKAAKKSSRTREETLDSATAAGLGKQANASHIIVVKMPVFERTASVNRSNRTKTFSYNVFITAEVIEVATERVVMVAQGKKSALDGMITINGGPDAAAVVAKIAKRAAAQIP